MWFGTVSRWAVKLVPMNPRVKTRTESSDARLFHAEDIRSCLSLKCRSSGKGGGCLYKKDHFPTFCSAIRPS